MNGSDSPQSSQAGAKPSCSIIIPTRDKLEFLKPCIDSIFSSAAAGQVQVIVVDNDSQEAATIAYLEEFARKDNCEVLNWDKPFNFSEINNYAATHCRADLLCFLNNDIEITQADWLDKLLPLARREDVGAVGCVLLYPDHSIQHAGIVLDEFSIARHIAHAEPLSFLSDQGLTAPYTVDAATAACLLVRKPLFEKLGGFNAEQLAVAFNDVDLCLRISDKGLPIILHPGVTLIHHESVSRKSDSLPANRSRAREEHQFMLQRWRHRLAGRDANHPLADLVQVADSNDQTDLDRLFAAASLHLYRDPVDATALTPGSNRVASLGYSDANYWRDHYLRLEGEQDALREHARNVEHHRQLIEQSPFWRMTAPLRRLKDLLLGKNADLPAADDSEDDSLNQSNEGLASTFNEADKADYKARAQRELDSFLASGESLDFSASDQARLTILIVLYNQAALTLLCLKSLLQHGDIPFRLVIIDNASSDQTEQLLDHIEGADIVRNADNLGFVLAVNQGADRVQTDFMLLLNNDAMLEEAALSSALNTINSSPDIGAVGGRIHLLDGRLQEAGSIIWNDGACLGYGRADNPELPAFQFRRDVDYCSGAFLLLRTRQFRDLGGFDTDYAPAYYEESDFCVRLHEQGMRVVYEPGAVITHYEFASAAGFSGASELQAAHRQLLCDKHPQYLSTRLSNDPNNVLAARHSNGFDNILVLDDRVPHPSLGAGYPRCAQLLAELSALELNITFFPMLFPTDDWQEVYTTLPREIEVMLDVGQVGLVEFLESRQGLYRYIMVSREHNMASFNRLTAERPDLLEGVEIIYDAEAVSAPREFLRRRLLGEELDASDEHAMLRQELELARSASHIITVSAREADYFRDAGFTNTAVVGHQLRVEPGKKTFAERKGLLFVGALRDEGSPNVDSLLWFLINVWPLIEQQDPDAELTVVGDNTAPSLSSVCKDNVHFLGRVDDITAQYNNSVAFIAPTRFAAGIPHKVHEAASHGLPSITTTLLATQLGWQNEKEILVADSAEDFASQCLRVMSDSGLWQSLRDQGLVSVADDCSGEAFRAALAGLFKQDDSSS